MLEWDFTPSAELVVRFVNMQALSGFALSLAGRVIGYAYYIAEEGKGLIGDLYVMREHHTWERENLLLRAVLDALVQVEGAGRVESQLMMLEGHPLPYPERLRAFPRTFMVKDLATERLPEGRAADLILLEPWRDERQEEAARLIAMAYQGHIDSLINDQYQSVPGSRRFLLNIVQYPGCGRFFPAGSFVAFRKDTGQPCGLSLSSLVAESVGHVTQVCVTPESRGCGIGYELLRRSLLELEAYGCGKVSLTVTSVNEAAIVLYERMGFVRRREFAAHVWEGF